MFKKEMKPFVKWAGGKGQILSDLTNVVPSHIQNYHELFVGGGALFFQLAEDVLHQRRQVTGTFYINDICFPLINTYQMIQLECASLLTLLEKYQTDYNSARQARCDALLSMETSTHSQEKKRRSSKAPVASHYQETLHDEEEMYYYLRDQYNKLKDCEDRDSVQFAALFIFLNKTSFRGLYRENQHGHFTTPFGHYSSPHICDRSNLESISCFLQTYPVIFSHVDFSQCEKNITKGDFVYIDSPYYPEEKKSFVGYTKQGFSQDDHQRLYDMVKKLEDREVFWMVSNSNTLFVQSTYLTEAKFPYRHLLCPRRMNAKMAENMAQEFIIHSRHLVSSDSAVLQMPPAT